MRDKLYGIFGLVSDQKLTMKPSYTTNIAEIYLHFALGLIEGTQSLRVICLAGVGVSENQRGLSLPTSVPGFCRDLPPQTLAVWPPLTQEITITSGLPRRGNTISLSYIPEQFLTAFHTHNSGNKQTLKNN
jgi:hypothetical protein